MKRLFKAIMIFSTVFIIIYLGQTTQMVYASGATKVADVTSGETANPVAAIGYKGYATLQEAFNEANNQTVTLLKDISDVEVTVASGKTIILELNGKTLTGVQRTGCVNTIINNGNLTINDGIGTGTVQSAGDVAYCVEYFRAVYNCGTLIINGGTYKSRCGDYNTQHGNVCALYNYSGNMTINGGQIEYT